MEIARQVEYCVILSSAPDAETARRMGRVLVEAGLAACATVLPGVLSIYRWEGKIEESAEALLLLKTQRNKASELLERLKIEHPYACPEGLILEVQGGLEAYLSWMDESLRA